MGRRLNGTINEDDLVERVLTWVTNPLFGDVIYDHRYTGYQDFGGVMFPTVMPAERILINADLYSPPAPGADPPATPNMRSLAHNIEQLGLDIARHVGVHGLVGSHVDFMRLIDGE